MSGVLARLVGRARGDAMHSLRPRLPARFETTGSEGGTGEMRLEPVVEIVQPAPRIPEAPQAETPAAPPRVRLAPPSAEPAQEARREPSRTSPRSLPEAGPTQPPPQPALRHTAAAPEAGPQAASPYSRPAPRETAGPSPAPDRPQPAYPQQSEAVAGRALSPDAAPAPLMPVAPRPSLAPATASPAAMPPAYRGAQQGRSLPAGTPDAPDIVINIGRIDLKSAPAPRERPKPARKPMGSLGDYLRERGGGR